MMGYGVFLASALLIKLSPRGLPAAYIIAAVFGLYMGVVETVQRALVPGYAGPGLRGTAYGVYYLVVGSAFFVANSVVGALWELYGSTAASLYSVVSSTIAIAAMLVFLKKRSKS